MQNLNATDAAWRNISAALNCLIMHVCTLKQYLVGACLCLFIVLGSTVIQNWTLVEFACSPFVSTNMQVS